ncbi:hypothetical protein EV714DRAFT_217046 [Schizophyllum commune]
MEPQEGSSHLKADEDSTGEHGPQQPAKRKAEDLVAGQEHIDGEGSDEDENKDEDEDEESEEEHDASPARKRRRLEYKKHERFWALDGNVILQLDGTSFKMHRSRLASHSPWFEALFERHAGRGADLDDDAPKTDGAVVEDGEDGLIIVNLNATGVLLEDFEELLTAMEDTIDYCTGDTPFPVHAAVYRAALRLRFMRFAEHSMECIMDDDEGFCDHLDHVEDGRSRRYIVDAILLGFGWGVRPLVKRGIYELARLPDLAELHANPPMDYRELSFDALEATYMQLVVSVQKKLAMAWSDALHDIMTSTTRCSSREKPCQSRDRNIMYEILYGTGIGKKYTLDPICGLQALIDLKWTNQGHCKGCAKARRDVLTAKRQKIWDDLDDWIKTEFIIY